MDPWSLIESCLNHAFKQLSIIDGQPIPHPLGNLTPPPIELVTYKQCHLACAQGGRGLKCSKWHRMGCSSIIESFWHHAFTQLSISDQGSKHPFPLSSHHIAKLGTCYQRPTLACNLESTNASNIVQSMQIQPMCAYWEKFVC